MINSIEAFPLSWPITQPRTRSRTQSRFESKSFAVARDLLLKELRLLGASKVILSTNIPLRKDGLPYSGVGRIQDSGVAIYFQFKNKSMVFACDRWVAIEDNLWAVCKTIEALRGIERWGAGEMMEKAFTGFQALPPPPPPESWRQILGVREDATAAEIKSAWKAKAMECHPDRQGGSHELMSKVNAAYAEAQRSGLV